MSMVTELFGAGVLDLSLDQFKQLMKTLPPTVREKRSYLLKDFARIKYINLKASDFIDVYA